MAALTSAPPRPAYDPRRSLLSRVKANLRSDAASEPPSTASVEAATLTAPAANPLGSSVDSDRTLEDPLGNSLSHLKSASGASAQLSAPAMAVDVSSNGSVGSRRVSSRTGGIMSPASQEQQQKKRKSFFGYRKSGFEARPAVPELPPTLSLNLPQDKPVAPPVAEIKADVKPEVPLRRGKSRKGAPPSPTPAAAIAMAAQEKVRAPATPAERLDVMKVARLDVKQMTELCSLCAKEIKMRGLATVGLFRPFRLAESPKKVDRLIELFLLAVDPKTYDGTFSAQDEGPSAAASALLVQTLGKPDAKRELARKLAYAGVHDVVALFKWGLRRLRLRPSDFASQEPLGWYDSFILAEKEASYPARAFREQLMPNLPVATASLLTEIFDLLSTVSAHHVANAMPASRICRTLGFWLFGRIGTEHPPHTLDELIATWTRSSAICEHLLLAFIRDQASSIHLMPTRLVELVENYPYIAPGATAPSLPRAFVARESRAMRVDLRSENVAVSPKRFRGPSETLRCAVRASLPDSESSAEADDWTAIVQRASAVASEAPPSDADELAQASIGAFVGTMPAAVPEPLKETEEDLDARREAALLKEEDVRILRLVETELSERRSVMSPDSPRSNNATLSEVDNSRPSSSAYSGMTPSQTTSSFASSRATSSNGSLSEFGALGGGSYGRAKAAGLSTLLEDESGASPRLGGGEGPLDFATFSSKGFESGNRGTADLTLKNVVPTQKPLADDFDEVVTLNGKKGSARRQSSFHSLRRRNTKHADSYDSAFMARVAATAKPKLSVTHVSTFGFDEALVSLWQDQLLDSSLAANFPSLFFAQLNVKTANRLLTTGMGGQFTSWLCISETVIPPRPPLPQGPGSGRRASSIYGYHSKGESAESISERRSIRSVFAPSLRSIGASFMKRRASVRKVASLIGIKSSSAKDSSTNLPGDLLPPVASDSKAPALSVPAPVSEQTADSTVSKGRGKRIPPPPVRPPPRTIADAHPPRASMSRTIPSDALRNATASPVTTDSAVTAATSAAVADPTRFVDAEEKAAAVAEEKAVDGAAPAPAAA